MTTLALKFVPKRSTLARKMLTTSSEVDELKIDLPIFFPSL